MLPTYAGKANFDLSKVSIVQTEPNVRNVTMSGGPVIYNLLYQKMG
jgi:hypothetical protein